MIGIDTNVLVRYIIEDDENQSRLAIAFLESLTEQDPAFVSLVTLAELSWVLSRTYKLGRPEFIRALKELLNSAELLIELDLFVRKALELFEQSNADFGDCLIDRCSRAAGCETVVTFDRKAAKSLGMKLLS